MANGGVSVTDALTALRIAAALRHVSGANTLLAALCTLRWLTVRGRGGALVRVVRWRAPLAARGATAAASRRVRAVGSASETDVNSAAPGGPLSHTPSWLSNPRRPRPTSAGTNCEIVG